MIIINWSPEIISLLPHRDMQGIPIPEGVHLFISTFRLIVDPLRIRWRWIFPGLDSPKITVEFPILRPSPVTIQIAHPTYLYSTLVSCFSPLSHFLSTTIRWSHKLTFGSNNKINLCAVPIKGPIEAIFRLFVKIRFILIVHLLRISEKNGDQLLLILTTWEPPNSRIPFILPFSRVSVVAVPPAHPSVSASNKCKSNSVHFRRLWIDDNWGWVFVNLIRRVSITFSTIWQII